MDKFLCGNYVFLYLRCISRSRISGPYGGSMFTLSAKLFSKVAYYSLTSNF